MSLEDQAPPLPGCLAGLSTQGEAETEVLAVVRAIEDQAAEAVRDLALAELELPAGAEAVTSKLIPLLEWSTLSYDKYNDEVLPSGCSIPEQEPVPPSIDNWARGAIPCKHASSLPCTPPSPSPRSTNGEEDPQVEQEAGGSSAAGGGGERGKSVAQRGAASVPGSRVRRTTDSHNGGRDQPGDGRAWRGGDGDGGEEEEEIMEVLRTLSDGDHHGGEEVLAGAGGIGDAIGRGRRHEERAFLEGLRRREEARTRELADTRERLERADKEAREKEERMKKELKGRDWVWGPDGEVLVLDVVPPEKIPGRVVPRVGVRDCIAPLGGGGGGGRSDTVGTNPASTSRKAHGGAADSVQTLGGADDDPKVSKGRAQDEPAKEGAGGGGGDGAAAAAAAGGGDEDAGAQKAGRGRRPVRKGGAVARKKKGDRPERFFEVSATSQPRLVDSLDLQAGVCVKEGGDERQGPVFEEVKDRKHFSRRDPPSKELPSKEPLLTLALESPGIDGETSSVRARAGHSLDPRPGRRRPSQGDPLSPPATYPARSASIGSGVGRDKHRSPGRNSIVDQVKTLDPLSGATRLEPVGVASEGGGRGRHRGRRLVVPGGGAEAEAFGVGADDNPEDDPHWRLFKEGGKGGDGGSGGSGFKPVPPPPLPRKRRSRQRPGVLAKPELRRPRDRGTRLPIPTVARKHLPPPPVGETMGHGLSPVRDRRIGLGASAAAAGVSVFGSDAGGPASPPGSYLSGYDNNGRGVAGRKRRGGGGDGGGYGEVGRNTMPRRGGGGGEEAGGEEFPALPGPRRQRPFLASPPVDADRGMPGGEEGGERKGRRRGSALRMGWVNSRRSQGTLQELLRTT
eukprot:g5126.t1